MVRNVPIVMNGVTGRMGTRQHLVRSVLAIRAQGGVALPGGEVAVPEPILVGRNEKKLRSLAEAHGIERWSTDLDESLADPEVQIYFDSQTTPRRTGAVRAAIEAGKHWEPGLLTGALTKSYSRRPGSFWKESRISPGPTGSRRSSRSTTGPSVRAPRSPTGLSRTSTPTW